METRPSKAVSSGDDGTRIVGRTSSLFTRVVRIFAEELAVPYELQVVPSLLSTETQAYGGNPGLRLPTLLIRGEPPAFGCINSCRALRERSARHLAVLWPEALTQPLARNAQELTLQSMSTEVSWIMIQTAGGEASPYAGKLRAALDGTLAWLDERVDDVMAELPPRDLSFFEVSLFCLVDHLPFRDVLSVEAYANLRRFRDRFAARASAAATPFRFDA